MTDGVTIKIPRERYETLHGMIEGTVFCGVICHICAERLCEKSPKRKHLFLVKPRKKR